MFVCCQVWKVKRKNSFPVLIHRHYPELTQPHRLRAQSHQNAPTSHADLQSGCPIFLPNWFVPGAPMTPSLRFNNVLRWQLTELRKVFYLPLPIYFKEYHSGIAKWKRYTGQDMCKGMRCFHPLSHVILLATCMCIPTPSSLNSLISSFMEVSLSRHDWSNHWQLVISSTLSLSPFPSGQGVELKILNL